MDRTRMRMNSGRIQVFHGGLVRLNIIRFSSRGSRPYLVLDLYCIIIEYINRTALSCTYNCIINIQLSTSTLPLDPIRNPHAEGVRQCPAKSDQNLYSSPVTRHLPVNSLTLPIVIASPGVVILSSKAPR